MNNETTTTNTTTQNDKNGRYDHPNHRFNIAIIDGIHLCLLNHHNDTHKQQQQQEKECKGWTVTNVPSIPLRSVPLIWRERCRYVTFSQSNQPCIQRDDNTNAMNGTYDQKKRTREEEEEEMRNMKALQSIEMRSLRLSSSSTSSTIHDIQYPKRIDETSSLSNTSLAYVDENDPIRIVQSCHSHPLRTDATVAAATTSGDNGNDDGAVPSALDETDSCREDGYAISFTRKDETVPMLKVHNRNAGCLIGDFCGVNGWEQILCLPPLSANNHHANDDTYDNVSENDNYNDDDDIDRRKWLLLNILLHSVLTDGTALMYSRTAQNIQWNTNTNLKVAALRDTLPTVNVLAPSFISTKQKPRINKNVGAKIQTRGRDCSASMESSSDRTNTNSNTNRNTKKRRRLSGEMDGGIGGNSSQSSYNPSTTTTMIRTTNTILEKSSSATTCTKSNWRHKLETSLHRRILKETKLQRERRQHKIMMESLVRRSQQTLQDFVLEGSGGETVDDITPTTITPTPAAAGTVTPITSTRNRIELVRIQYETVPLPSTSYPSSNSNPTLDSGLNVRVHLDVDLHIPTQDNNATNNNNNDNNINTNNNDNTFESNQGLNEVHLFCSPVSSGSYVANQIRSRSGVVPFLRTGECVTVTMVLEISDMTRIVDLFPRDETASPSQINSCLNQSQIRSQSVSHGIATGLAIHASWKTSRRRGLLLGVLHLPLESILLTRQSLRNGYHPSRHHHHRHLQTIRFSNGPDAMAVFEYRNPRIIVIDVSSSLSGASIGQVGQQWEELVRSLNEVVGIGSRVDLGRTVDAVGGAKVELVLFGDSPQSRAALVDIVLNYFPESAIVTSTESTTSASDTYNAKALIASLDREVQLINQHRSLQNENFSIENIREMAESRCITDEISSRMMQGNSKPFCNLISSW